MITVQNRAVNGTTLPFGFCSHSRHTRKLSLALYLSLSFTQTHTHLPLGGLEREGGGTGSTTETAYLITCTNIETQFNILPDTPPNAHTHTNTHVHLDTELCKEGLYTYNFIATSHHTGLMRFPTPVRALKVDHALFQSDFNFARKRWHTEAPRVKTSVYGLLFKLAGLRFFFNVGC